MVSGNFAATNVAHLPWNAPDGLPERVVQAPATSLQSDTLPPVRRGELEVRALPTGSVHVLAPLDGAGLVVRLSHPPARIGFATAGQVTDAIMQADGRVIILERIDGSFTARELKPSQSTGWRTADLAITGSEVPRLLADARGRVFVASSDRLISLQDGIGRLVARWPPGVPPLMHPDGRLAFVRYDVSKGTRDWVLLDPETGAESSVDGSEDAWLILGRPIGVDAAARAYGYSAGVLGRMGLDGRLDWRLEIAGAAVGGPDEVTLMCRREDRGWTLVGGGDSKPADLPEECADARLVGRGKAGGYVLYRRGGGGFGTLLYLDPSGCLIGSESAPGDVWLSHDDLRPPSVSSVTPDGEVVVAVLTPKGLHVISLHERL